MSRVRVLEKELRTFEQKRQELVKKANGKYALVYGEQLAGVFDSLQDTFAAGYEQFGNVPFLVKEIREKDPVYFVG